MTDGYKGALTPESSSSQYNSIAFIAAQILGKANFATLVQVKAVTNNGSVTEPGFVDILPLVSQLDGNGNAVSHGVLHQVPYVRIQGGQNAVILDPQVGDIGIAIFADKDISAVKASKGPALPGSGRRFNMADGIYIGGLLNGIPNQYVRFSAGGIEITSPAKVTINATEIDIVGTLKNNGVNVGSSHVHGGVAPGSSNTNGPT